MWTETDFDADATRPADLDDRAWFSMESRLAHDLADQLRECASTIAEERYFWDSAKVDELLDDVEDLAGGLSRIALAAELDRSAKRSK